jgi:integrase
MATEGIKKHVARNGVVRWRVRVELPPDPVTGRRRGSMKTFKTVAAAKAARASWTTEIERGTAIDPPRMTVGEYLAQWLETVRPNVNPATYASYECISRSRIVPIIGTVPLQKLTALRVQGMYTTLLTGPRGDGKQGRRSNRTVRMAHVLLKQAFKQAMRWRLVPHNVIDDVDPPRAVRPRVECWDEDEARAFLTVTEGDGYGALWITALHTGMRLGGLLALQWGDVDLRKGVIHVRRGGSDDDTKSQAGRHNPEAIEALQAQGEARPLPIASTALVFTSIAGTPLDQGNVRRRFYTLVRKAGLKNITIHGLRHTHATLLLLHGVDIKTVSMRLGHASIQITLDTYAHVLPQMEEKAAAAIGAALARRA